MGTIRGYAVSVAIASIAIVAISAVAGLVMDSSAMTQLPAQPWPIVLLPYGMLTIYPFVFAFTFVVAIPGAALAMILARHLQPMGAGYWICAGGFTALTASAIGPAFDALTDPLPSGAVSIAYFHRWMEALELAIVPGMIGGVAFWRQRRTMSAVSP